MNLLILQCQRHTPRTVRVQRVTEGRPTSHPLTVKSHQSDIHTHCPGNINQVRPLTIISSTTHYILKYISKLIHFLSKSQAFFESFFHLYLHKESKKGLFSVRRTLASIPFVHQVNSSFLGSVFCFYPKKKENIL